MRRREKPRSRNRKKAIHLVYVYCNPERLIFGSIAKKDRKRRSNQTRGTSPFMSCRLSFDDEITRKTKAGVRFYVGPSSYYVYRDNLLKGRDMLEALPVGYQA